MQTSRLDRSVPSNKQLGLALLALTLMATAVAGNDQIPGAPQDHPILLRGGDLYTVSNGVLPATDLLFDDGKITGIGNDLDLPEGTEILDVSGQRVYPGLIAPHTYLGLIEVNAVRASDDRREIGDLTPEVAAHTAINYDSEILPTIRNRGITTAQVLPQPNLIGGRPFITHLDGWSTEDAAVELFDGLVINWPATPSDADDSEAFEQRRALRNAFDAALAYRSARSVDPTLPVDQRWEAMLPTLDGEQNLYAIASEYGEILEAVSFAREYGLKLVLYGAVDSHLVASLLAEEKIPVVLQRTHSTPRRADDDYDLPYKTAALLDAAGVKFAFSAATRMEAKQRDLPFQAGHAVGFGLPPETALRSLTLTTAEILGIDDRQGSLDVGKQATLFVSEGDVMDYLTQDVTLMFIDGRAVDLDDKQRELDRKYRTKLERRQADD